MPTCPDMSLGLARRMVTLTSAFYREQAASFSATRQSAWPGWERLLELLPPDPPSLGVVDVACGNQRLGRFLKERLPHTQLSYVGVDNCRPLAGDAPLVEVDVARTLLERPLLLDLPEADVAVSFGFMHHLPTAAARERLLASLVAAVRPGGLAVVTGMGAVASRAEQLGAAVVPCVVELVAQLAQTGARLLVVGHGEQAGDEPRAPDLDLVAAGADGRDVTVCGHGPILPST